MMATTTPTHYGMTSKLPIHLHFLCSPCRALQSLKPTRPAMFGLKPLQIPRHSDYSLLSCWGPSLICSLIAPGSTWRPTALLPCGRTRPTALQILCRCMVVYWSKSIQTLRKITSCSIWALPTRVITFSNKPTSVFPRQAPTEVSQYM